MKRKIVSLIILFSFIIQFWISLVSYAESSSVVFSAENKNVTEGETFEVSINVNCVADFVATNMEITYDTSFLEYVPYYDSDKEVDETQNKGTLISGGNISINSSNAGLLKVGYMSQKSLQGKNGQFLKFQFKVKDGVKTGSTNIALKTTTLKNENGTNVTPEFVNGKISIIEKTSQSEITLNSPSVTMNIGEEKTVSISSELSSTDIEWSCSPSGIVTITPSSDKKSVKITAVKSGSATITVKVADKTSTCKVTINEAPAVDTFTLQIVSPKWTKLPVGQIRTLEVKFTPASANSTGVKWSSSNTNVATIDEKSGKVIALSKGTTTITASVEDKTATYVLTVDGKLGEIDGDNVITSYDAYRALKLYAYQENKTAINEDDVVILDVEKDGNMSPNDAYLILLYSVGEITKF